MITHESSLESFHEQIQYVLNNYKCHGLNASQFSNVFIGGLGGSGIGGKIVKGIFSSRFPLPVEVVSDYTLPFFVNEKSLVILSSYSGNTEETLSLFEQAKSRNSTILAVTAGGKLMELAVENNLIYNTIETGFQPRMALGYSLGFLIKIFAELIGENLDADLEKVVESLKDNGKHKEIAQNMQKKFKQTLRNKYVIVCDAAFEGVAIRFQQQINENSKMEAFVNVLPEANHNVIESYYGLLPGNFVMLNSNSNDRVAARFDFLIALLERENNKVMSLETEGLDLQTLFDLIHALDWFTIDITEPLGVDPMQIENIISLKDYLAGV